MATRPTLHIAVANTKSKASDYNENFTLMMNYCEDVAEEDKDYVDSNINNRADRTLANVTSLSNEIKALLGNDYATKDLSNVTGGSISGKMTSTDKANIIDFCSPDYSRRISLANFPLQDTPYEATEYGLLFMSFVSNINSIAYLYINGSEISIVRDTTDNVVNYDMTFPLTPGDKVYWSKKPGDTNVKQLYFVPYKGV
ncbi:MAG: hypothetical protein MJ180_00180 [Candidatus Gastranaerophilales bacterium]|nr:hypothetical protein [Candidatus Gastranaerophilales bacterium]